MPMQMYYDRTMIQRRAELCRAVREFFCSRGYLEVETPLLSPGLIPEPSISVFETLFTHPFSGSVPCWLVPSPEVYMKQLLAAGSGSIFQISKCFRNCEQVGKLHNPEFTMLEWYTVEADYRDSITCAEQLFEAAVPSYAPDYLRPPFAQVTMRELWHRFLGLDLDALHSFAAMRRAASGLGLNLPESAGADSWESLFNRVFLTFIEPELPQERPLAVLDYPSRIECLAAEKTGTPYKERWELYAGGVELANCYTEARDPVRIAEVFRSEAAVSAQLGMETGTAVPDLPEGFLELFQNDEQPFPRCSGTALGMDRLLMLISGKSDLRGVILFPLSATV
jgi:elongation factor P--(R)-beta-lysine ligase